MKNRIIEQIKTYAQELNELGFKKEVERKKSLGFEPGQHFLCYKVNKTQATEYNQYVILNFRKSGSAYIAFHESRTAKAAIYEINSLLGGQSSFIKTSVDKNSPLYCKMTIENEYLTEKAELVEVC